MTTQAVKVIFLRGPSGGAGGDDGYKISLLPDAPESFLPTFPSTRSCHCRGIFYHAGRPRKREEGHYKAMGKREEQITRVMQATVGMYGDLQGIDGKSLQKIEGLEYPAIEDDTETE